MNLQKYYSPYTIKPSEEALELWRRTSDAYEESIHIQVRRTPAFLEYVFRRKDTALMKQALEEDLFFLDHSSLPYFIQWD